MDDTGLFDRIDFEDAAPPCAVPRGTDALQSDVLVGLLDEIDYGLMVLGADARILLANQLARLELAGGSHLRRCQGKLAAGSPRDDSKIAAALGSVRQGQRSLVTLSGPDGELTLSFVPLHAGARLPARNPGVTLALVMLGKRNVCEATTLQKYAQLHRLTGTEQALLPAIVRGLSVKAIANQRSVSASTVRAHLCSIRAKTGARSLRTLMARITSLPPA